MYENFTNTSRPHGAFEIEMRARKLEKQYALMNYLDYGKRSSGVAENLVKTTRRIGSLIGSLFM